MTQLIIIGCYLAALLCLGIFSSTLFRGTSKDYMLASHSIGPFLLLMSIFGTTMTAFALVGSTGEAFSRGIGVYGMLASSSGIIHSLCFFLLGIKLWSLGKKYGYTTQIQFFRDRLQSDKIGLLLFPILVTLVIPYLLIGVMASGGVINGVTQGTFEAGTFPSFLEIGDAAEDGTPGTMANGSKGGVPREIASAVICVVVLIYVFFGGMRGTAWANAFQTIVFMILGIVTFYVISTKLTGESSLFTALQKASEAIPEAKATREGISKSAFLTYMLVPLSVGMFPHLFQHWLTAKNAEAFKLPVVAHPLFIMIVWVPCVLVGAWATSDLIQIPPPIQANQNLVLPFMVKKLAGPMLGGFLTAGILAAIMSSLDSQFLCLGTMFTQDIAVHYGGKDRFSDKQVVVLARCFIIGIVLLTYFFSLFEPRAVFVLGVWCFSGFSALFPLVFGCLYWRGVTKAGAYACVLAAFSSWWYLFWQSGFAEDERYTVDYTIGGVTYPTMPVLTMVVCSTVALIVVSLITKKPDEETLARFFPTKA
ncbi:sodium:solute symporter family protein [Calycomorphotria hydatis]|uniref:Sodium/proline symporter n=1 Tax=Calycomorphotria hydatis TaxID=2528027 RepID=A0A517T9K8_9PLAN|nr:sodium:solute symporter family protein [Calycomorphotria hydatis]QDT65057.1 Sodium/proline symporter [Calycomorphotria hydatis]